MSGLDHDSPGPSAQAAPEPPPEPPLESPFRVLIFEPDHLGHRLSTVRTLIDSLQALREATRRRIVVTVALSADAVTSAEYRQQIHDVQARFETLTVPTLPYGAAPNRIAAVKADALQALLGEHCFDHLYVPYGDGLVQWLGLRRLRGGGRLPPSLTAEAVLMRSGFAYRRSGPRAWLNLVAIQASPFDRLHVIDPVAFQALERLPRSLRRRLSLMPDPTPAERGVPREVARQALGLPVSGRYVGCVGYQDERKGIPALVAAFGRMRAEPDDRLLLAGSQSPAVRALLATKDDPRIISLDRYLTEDELTQAVSALDLMVTPYTGFDGSASICIRAAGAGRKVLAGRNGWMGSVVPQFDLGWVCEVEDVDSLSAAMARHLPQATAFQGDTRMASFCRYHQPANVSAHWTRLLRERLGLPGTDAALPWPGPGMPSILPTEIA